MMMTTVESWVERYFFDDVVDTHQPPANHTVAITIKKATKSLLCTLFVAYSPSLFTIYSALKNTSR